jgi:hypothetical protein
MRLLRAVLRLATLFGVSVVAILVALHFIAGSLPVGCQRVYSHPPPNECQGEPRIPGPARTVASALPR